MWGVAGNPRSMDQIVDSGEKKSKRFLWSFLWKKNNWTVTQNVAVSCILSPPFPNDMTQSKAITKWMERMLKAMLWMLPWFYVLLLIVSKQEIHIKNQGNADSAIFIP